ncbi:MAG: hypothetical protein ACJ0BN_11885 [Limisphaerales bacterium]|nr:hypothetical protein [Verrucomicrobiae bacterium]
MHSLSTAGSFTVPPFQLRQAGGFFCESTGRWNQCEEASLKCLNSDGAPSTETELPMSVVMPDTCISVATAHVVPVRKKQQ